MLGWGHFPFNPGISYWQLPQDTPALPVPSQEAQLQGCALLFQSLAAPQNREVLLCNQLELEQKKVRPTKQYWPHAHSHTLTHRGLWSCKNTQL